MKRQRPPLERRAIPDPIGMNAFKLTQTRGQKVFTSRHVKLYVKNVLKILLGHGHLPFSSKHKTAFWKNCREGQDVLTADIFKPRHLLSAEDRIATAGSCFAQHIGAYVRKSDLNSVDSEPAPHGLAADVAKTYGFEMFSARYGNLYTPRQLRQLLSDVVKGEVHDAAVWEQDGFVAQIG
jgi:hypothetical protein